MLVTKLANFVCGVSVYCDTNHLALVKSLKKISTFIQKCYLLKYFKYGSTLNTLISVCVFGMCLKLVYLGKKTLLTVITSTCCLGRYYQNLNQTTNAQSSKERICYYWQSDILSLIFVVYMCTWEVKDKNSINRCYSE